MKTAPFSPTLVSLLKTLGNKRRLKILEQLLEEAEGAKLSELAQKTNLTVQEIHRTLSNMQEVGLVARDLRKRYRLTSLGTLIYKNLKEIDALLDLENI